jgi:hypothetical protein
MIAMANFDKFDDEATEPTASMPAVAEPAEDPAESDPDYHDRRCASVLHRTTMSAYLRGTLDRWMREAFSSRSVILYLMDYKEQAGNPTDPIEIMLLEQLMIAHHAVGRLQMQVAHAATAEEAGTYTVAVTRLLGELRRMALAIRDYRNTMAPKQLTVVKQQNVAAGNQQVAYIDGQPVERFSQQNNPDTELTSPCMEAISHESERSGFSCSPRDWRREVESTKPAETVEARLSDARGT